MEVSQRPSDGPKNMHKVRASRCIFLQLIRPNKKHRLKVGQSDHHHDGAFLEKFGGLVKLKDLAMAIELGSVEDERMSNAMKYQRNSQRNTLRCIGCSRST